MQPCPIAQRNLAPGQRSGCKLIPGLQRARRGAPLVCRTAAPTWSEQFEAARAALRSADLDEEVLPSTSAAAARGWDEPTRTPPSIKDTGTLRPSAEWYPAWMQYRRREDNYVFWQDKFMRCSLDIPWTEKRWTVFSTFWYVVMHFKYYMIPPAFRYVWFLLWRGVMSQLYAAHKALVLWQCKLDAYLARLGSGGAVTTFSKSMALRRLHWKNSPVAELLYAINVYQTGRIHLLPPVAKPIPRPTFFFLF
ncbi:hypothetical protein PLESTB_000686100 [Pleodorina starrii]|uniref:Uncharacterized protein n=1 Tax=Pleodorina starrii TaxID=330485 RepID=A0A9W6BIL9_9CHLO|nr:hypothetical protein PLESTM_001230900 [Pleodorina starrii]GLC52901.1 hypothetical protein PLESTB_000686100 [Pleodorina starrii]GLC65200.1 hypothetical protein PLESTF_000262800 [Pleodorina starrii]